MINDQTRYINMKIIKRRYKQFRQAHDATPTIQELMDISGLDRKHVKQALQDLNSNVCYGGSNPWLKYPNHYRAS